MQGSPLGEELLPVKTPAVRTRQKLTLLFGLLPGCHFAVGR